MDSRTKGVIATVGTAVICGCFGLLACVFGIVGALQVPFETSVNDVPTGSAPMPATWGYTLICASIIFFIIPIVVGFVTLRKKSPPPDMSGPVPPAA